MKSLSLCGGRRNCGKLKNNKTNSERILKHVLGGYSGWQGEIKGDFIGLKYFYV